MKRSTRTAINNLPILTARTTSYRGYAIVQYREPEGNKYVVQTLTGHSVLVTRSFVEAKRKIDTLASHDVKRTARTR